MNRHALPTRLQSPRIFTWNRFAALPAVVAVLLVSGCETMQSKQSVTEVRQAKAEFYTALNAMFKGDAKPMEKVWSHSDDVTYLPPGGGRYDGWDAVRKNWEEQADLKLGGSNHGEDIRVVMAGPMDAIVTARSVGTNPNVPGGPMHVDIRTTAVYRKEAGQWKLIHFHTDKLPKLKAAESATGR